MGGGKLENAEKSPRSRERTNNKFNAHKTLSTGMEPGSHRCFLEKGPKKSTHFSQALINRTSEVSTEHYYAKTRSRTYRVIKKESTNHELEINSFDHLLNVETFAHKLRSPH